jgi:adenosylmethionine-8-amino-7-oxononanoate aminotransferase
VFYSDSGSTAVEVALKMALGFWANRGIPRHGIAVLEHSYHGDTIGAMSVGERGVFNAPYEPLLFDVTTIPFPGPGNEQDALDALETACRSDGLAALIAEPLILGAGGMLTYSPQVLRQMREICAAHEVLFIADEVMTGWGRTGTLLACQQAAIAPDILCLAKGLTGGAIPLAVTMATPEVFAAHYSTDRAKQFFHSSSYTANPIACAAANANLAIWNDEPVQDRIDALARAQAAGLTRLAQLPGTANPRQLGTILALDIEVPDSGYLSDLAPRLLRHFRENDLLLRPLGNTVYIMPPYCITPEQLDRVHDGIATAIADVTA